MDVTIFTSEGKNIENIRSTICNQVKKGPTNSGMEKEENVRRTWSCEWAFTVKIPKVPINCVIVTVFLSTPQGALNVSGANTVTEFILLSFPCSREVQLLLFVLFSVSYMLTLMGNGAIVVAVRLDHRLHTPMYILLANFSFLEICYINTTVPNMLHNFLSETKTISFTACFLQFYFFFSMGITETFLLPLMAFDRYLAICHPLHYPTIMSSRLCMNLVALCWVAAFLCYPVPIYFITQLPFCGPNTIDHFVCDPGPILALSCIPAPGIELSCSILNSLIIFIAFFFILASYTLVLRAVLRVPSAAGRRKAFSTCGSHLAVVSLFYGTVMLMYISPTSGNAAGIQKIVTLFYSSVTPLVNPLIYSLRNKDMKAALRKFQMCTKVNQSE
ncbi:olfactory receptor 11H6 [Tupaia chinensis]|uniref:olfactory receptor 11H6 n=1 Tax=Tupaia chinensis TaxID=246437 RepID=UPI000FFB525B|nr:olfactory receptor 11H6 [Tupaia chinensis]